MEWVLISSVGVLTPQAWLTNRRLRHVPTWLYTTCTLERSILSSLGRIVSRCCLLVRC